MNKKISVMQPYFFPYLGYWQLLHEVDTFICFDDVNFINKGWINRNKIIMNGQETMITLNLSKASQNKKINEIDIFGNNESMLKTIDLSYRRSLNYLLLMPILEGILRFEEKNLAIFLANSIHKISALLKINTTIISSSEFGLPFSGKEKIIPMCKVQNGAHYVNPIGGIDLYKHDEFNAHGLRLSFLQSDILPYSQNSKLFISKISIIDFLMNVAEENWTKHLNSYRLIDNV